MLDELRETGKVSDIVYTEKDLQLNTEESEGNGMNESKTDI